ncbi:MAG: hypothetical protein BHV77_04530 [Bacteroides sp. 43_108]|nr:MAG: hypothetical protein BHV77_04530 [Bacteroides sp. 43_108]
MFFITFALKFNDMVLDIDSIIPFSKRHKGETVREIIRYDSGYLKDLMIKDDRVVFSDTCFKEKNDLLKVILIIGKHHLIVISQFLKS